jgi:D-alanyl-lipoteichoic acid acyltransferase DltB (MBOAT superfamily)
MWQDKVFALCQLAFFPSMIPTLRGADKPALSTCVMNSVIVATIAATQATLSLWLAVSSSMLIVGVWAVLAMQKFRLDGR